MDPSERRQPAWAIAGNATADSGAGGNGPGSPNFKEASKMIMRNVELTTGRLEVQVHQSLMPIDDLCGFAARQNPKRGFLFVSKVLGKHIPAKPSLMRQVQFLLANQIAIDLPGPVVVIGMAETATALGHGVFDTYIALSKRSDVVFLHSTRYRHERQVAFEFLEEHSHAADHIIYMPEDINSRILLENARSVVLVDDEVSSGKTFVNLTTAFKKAIPTLCQAVTCVITDWRGPARTSENNRAMPVPYTSVAILQGEYSFQPKSNLSTLKMPNVKGNGQCKDTLIRGNFGRFGIKAEPFAESPLDRLFQRAIERDQVRSLLKARGRLLLLGTGEFSYMPFLLAEHLEKMGLDVRCQTTTRSPILLGEAIGCAHTFVDNYDDHMPNYVYNVVPSQYASIIVCHETPASSLDESFITALQAETLEF